MTPRRAPATAHNQEEGTKGKKGGLCWKMFMTHLTCILKSKQMAQTGFQHILFGICRKKNTANNLHSTRQKYRYKNNKRLKYK